MIKITNKLALLSLHDSDTTECPLESYGHIAEKSHFIEHLISWYCQGTLYIFHHLINSGQLDKWGNIMPILQMRNWDPQEVK